MNPSEQLGAGTSGGIRRLGEELSGGGIGRAGVWTGKVRALDNLRRARISGLFIEGLGREYVPRRRL